MLTVAPAAEPESAPVAAATNLEDRIKKADQNEVSRELQALSGRIQVRRAELLRQPEITKLDEANRKAQTDYHDKLTANPEYAAALKQHDGNVASFKAQAARALKMSAHYKNHRTPALVAEQPDSLRLGRVPDCEFCEAAYAGNPDGDPAVFRRQHEQYQTETARYRELGQALLAWPRQEKALSARLRRADVELDRLARAAAQANQALGQAVDADPLLRQLAEQSERWRYRGYELRPTAK